MASVRPSVRLYVEDDLAAGATVGLAAAQAHYLHNVMRLGRDDEVAVFNGRDGEWRATVDGVGRGWCSLAVVEETAPQSAAPDLWLVFAPVKRARLDYVAAKATELGVAALWPVFTRHTSVTRVNTDRLRANAVEAAEQCGRMDVPEVLAPAPLARCAGGLADRSQGAAVATKPAAARRLPSVWQLCPVDRGRSSSARKAASRATSLTPWPNCPLLALSVSGRGPCGRRPPRWPRLPLLAGVDRRLGRFGIRGRRTEVSVIQDHPLHMNRHGRTAF